MQALQNKGLFQSLAEPNLIAENGKEASFLAGGEYPYPVVQGQAGGTTVTIQFKEFGIRLNFTPTIVGDDLVKLKVMPEVSSLDFSNALTLQGFRVPAISTRRTQTEVELQDGQTFAIAGLLNNTLNSTMSKIPGIGDIPILGYLFKSKAVQRNQTELVVMITPTILRKGSTGVSPKLPNLMEQFMPPASKTLPSPAPWNPAASGQASVEPAAAPTVVPATPGNRPAFAQAPQQPAPAGVPVAEPEPVQITPSSAPSAPVPVSATNAQGKAVKPSKAEKAALEQARKQDEAARKQQAKQAEEDKKKAAEVAKLQAEQAEKDMKEAAKAAREQAKLQAEVDRRAAEASKRQAENGKKQSAEDKKKAQQLAEAQARLDAARQAYDQEVAKISPATPAQQK